MFGANPFYYGLTRKYIALFGSLFSNIILDRVDNTGTQTQVLKVPLSYGPKDRYLARLQQNEDLLRNINQVLPRMAFMITGVYYDADRKLNTLNQTTYQANTSSPSQSQYGPLPYNFDIQLSILARNSDDAMRIVEQIIPWFKPDWTVKVNLIPEMALEMNIPIILNSIQYEEEYEGSFDDRFAFIWNLNFTLKGYLFGPISTQNIIKNVVVNFYTPSTNTATEGVGITPISEWVSVLPGLTANGLPTSNVSLSIPLADITANSNYGFITDFYNSDVKVH